MKSSFNELFKGYSSGVYKMIKIAIKKYCKLSRNRDRYEAFMMSQRFEISKANFMVLGKDRFDFLFEVIAYEFFADEFVPKYAMVIASENMGDIARINISSRVYNYNEE